MVSVRRVYTHAGCGIRHIKRRAATRCRNTSPIVAGMIVARNVSDGRLRPAKSGDIGVGITTGESDAHGRVKVVFGESLWDAMA